MEKIIVKSLEEIDTAAEKILNKLSQHRIFAFYGDMGAGKTTLIKSICNNLGVTEAVTSPTFTIVNEYNCGDNPVYHFDFFRINSESEAYDLGYETYFYSGHYCFIEWPEKIKTLMPPDHASILISVKDEIRQITINA